jgi:hypothetical protein
MNEQIKQLAEQAGWMMSDEVDGFNIRLEKFVELLKQAIYDQVKEELIPDELVDIEPDSLMRQYLKGCNGGTVDALIHIKNFGVDIDE